MINPSARGEARLGIGHLGVFSGVENDHFLNVREARFGNDLFELYAVEDRGIIDSANETEIM